ncbi:MAG: hypothetical protein N3D82_05560 [Ignisphaera sp.]|nr:hypothetical protein [Ignisphaera sp.]MCX8168472.1 hypothetical protein [Ignisphaera sp.]MDW8085088.1 hypothetical protein [Ignisphaera sp.]
MVKISVGTVVGHYVAIEVKVEDAVDIINALKKALNKGGDDVSDTIRMIQYFDVFYNIMHKKFKEYLTPRKDVSDLIKGNVLIDRIRLIKKDSGKYVIIVFDKSVSKETLVNTLINLGYEVANM